MRDGWGGGGVGHAPALGDGGDGEDAFHPGEALADALAAASAEGEVGELWAGGFVLGGEAVGVEAEWVGEVLGGAAHDVLAEEEVGSGGDAVGAEGDGFGGHASHGPGGWVETHGFGEDLFGVAEVGVVGEGGEAVGSGQFVVAPRPDSEGTRWVRGLRLVRRGVWLRLRGSG